MKKRQGLQRAIEPMALAELQASNTGALMARLNRLRFCEESRGHSDLSDDEVKSVQGLILFKSDAAWKQAYKDIKSVLAAREHLSNKPKG